MLWLLALAFKGSTAIRDRALGWSFLFFLLLTVGAVAVTRSGFGLSQALSSRYELIPAGFVAVLYLTTLQVWPRRLKRHFVLIMLFSVALYATRMDANYTEIVDFRERLESGILMYAADDSSALSVSPTTRNEMVGLLEASVSTGNYRLPLESLLTTPVRRSIEEPPENGHMHTHVTMQADSDDVYYAKGWAFMDGLDTQDLHIYFVLKSDRGQIFAFECESHIQKDVTRDYGHGLYLDTSGFSVVLPKRKLGIPPARYATGVYLAKGEARSLHYFGTNILVP